jgi:hypothetical protein
MVLQCDKLSLDLPKKVEDKTFVQRPWNYHSRLRPCFNCGQQYERDSVVCTACGAIRGITLHGDDELKKKEKYITLSERQSATFALLEDSIRNRFVNAFQISLELLNDWINDKWQHYKRRMRPATSSASRGIDSNLCLGDLYRVHLSDKKSSSDLPEVAARVPDLDYIGAFFYEDLVRNARPSDLKTWRSSIEKADSRLLELIQPYIVEVYCRGKAVFIGAELRASGVWSFGKWNTCLLAQLNPEERKIIVPFSRQIYRRVKDILRDNAGTKGGIEMTTGQRRTIMAGLGLVLLMLLIPPWKSSLGSRRGYGFIVAPPRGATSIDMSRLFVQTIFVVLLAGGIVFALHNREK